MNPSTFASLSAAFALSALAVACGGSTTSAKSTEPGTSKASLVFKAPCARSACPSSPSGDDEAYVCQETRGECEWSAGGAGLVGGSDDPNGTVSYRECAPAECAGPEIAPDCPSGTHSLGLRCGSENEAVCTRYAVCVPDESDAGATVTCAPDSCGPIPEIAELCADGTSRGLVCRAKGSKCLPLSACPENL